MEEISVSPIIQRLCNFIEHSGLTNSQFADRAGIPRPSLSQLLHGRNKSLSSQVLEKLSESFPQLNIVWLISGRGNMLATSGQNSNSEFSERQSIQNSSTLDAQGTYGQPNTDSLDVSNDGLFGLANSENASNSVQNADFPANSSTSAPSAAAPAADTPLPPIQSVKLVAPEAAKDGGKRVSSIIVFFSDGSFQSFVPSQPAE